MPCYPDRATPKLPAKVRQPTRCRFQVAIRLRRRRLAAQSCKSSDSHRLVRVLTATDLHCDYPENLDALSSWPAARNDVFVCCGDACDNLETLESVLRALVDKYAAVFYTPGNHELWVRKQDRTRGLCDSLSKLSQLLKLCGALGVHVTPRALLGGRLWVAPLLSWHHRTWDREPDIPGCPPASTLTISDYAATAWPAGVPGGDQPGSSHLADWFDSLNDTPAWRQLLAARDEADVITASHFLPHQSLLPEKRFLFFANLAKAVGSDALRCRVACASPDIHLFGHSHFSWDATEGGVRYIQAPLCSPLERKRRLQSVGFEGLGMQAAAADPLAARWLPVPVYETLATEEEVRELRALGRGGPPDASLTAVLERIDALLAASGTGSSSATCPQEQQRQQQREWLEPGACNAAAPKVALKVTGSRPVCSAGTSVCSAESLNGAEEAALLELDRELHGVAPSDVDSTSSSDSEPSEPPDAHGAAAHAAVQVHDTDLCGSSAKQQNLVAAGQLDAWSAAGMPMLRHGAMAAPLGAHWSSYYADFPRTPEVLLLAPWVARRYERRIKRQQQAAAQAAGSNDGSSSRGTSVEG